MAITVIRINLLFFRMGMEYVYSEVQIEFLYYLEEFQVPKG
jgi:hypothetical protein